MNSIPDVILVFALVVHSLQNVIFTAERHGTSPTAQGISNAMIFASLRHATRAQRLVSRRMVSHLAAWSTAVEVGIITLQAWRDHPLTADMLQDLVGAQD